MPIMNSTKELGSGVVSVTISETSTASGGFVMGRMAPVSSPFKGAKPSVDGCTVNVLPANTILPGVAMEELILASHVKFGTHSITSALAAKVILNIAAILNVKTLFVIGAFLARPY
jgi:hypothetical protein